jgi:hypothetical protein
MPQYRIYQVRDNHIAGPPIEIEAESDDAAITQTKQMLDGADLELWNGARFVIGLRSQEK